MGIYIFQPETACHNGDLPYFQAYFLGHHCRTSSLFVLLHTASKLSSAEVIMIIKCQVSVSSLLLNFPKPGSTNKKQSKDLWGGESSFSSDTVRSSNHKNEPPASTDEISANKLGNKIYQTTYSTRNRICKSTPGRISFEHFRRCW